MERVTTRPFRTFADSYAYIAQFTNYERMTTFRYDRNTLDLNRVRAVLQELGNPDKRCPIVHVAGTKGKGSVCAMIASVLQSASYRVGLFSKPHLIKLNERISLDGRDIPDKNFVEMMNLLYPHLERQRLQGHPLTFFDLITVLALAYFAQQQVDFIVLEVGLGGRLDSTNVVHSAVSVITGIDFDHTHILGDTLEEIAAEKAGIIKPKVPVISGVEAPRPAGVIQKMAKQKKAPLFMLGKDFRLKEIKECETFRVETWRGKYRDLRLPLLGAHQRRNAAVAVAALEVLKEAIGVRVQEEHIREGLANVRLRGRTEILSKNPTVILDVAHNPVSLRALRETVTSHWPSKRIVLLLGMSRDKDIQTSLREILPIVSSAIFTTIGHPRGMDTEELLKLAQDLSPGLHAEAEPDIEKALQKALKLTGSDDLLCIAGSFYLAGEVAARWASPHDAHH